MGEKGRWYRKRKVGGRVLPYLFKIDDWLLTGQKIPGEFDIIRGPKKKLNAES